MRTGRGAGRGVAVGGGGLVAVIIAVVALLFGVDPFGGAAAAA